MSPSLSSSLSNGSLQLAQRGNQNATLSKTSKGESTSTHLEDSVLPANFGEVVQGVYRSSFPKTCNLPALQRLRLKTIMTLVDEEYSESHAQFLEENGVTHYKIRVQSNKDSTVIADEATVVMVLKIILDKRNHPVLVHCNKGKHRTGCIIGCFRKLQGWTMPAIMAEYVKYSEPKSRALDMDFIESFDRTKLSMLAESIEAAPWVPTICPIEDGQPVLCHEVRERASSAPATPFLFELSEMDIKLFI